MMIKMKTIMIIRIMMVMVMDHDGDSDDHHIEDIDNHDNQDQRCG